MTLKGIRDALQTALETVSGLRVHDTVPEGIMEVPCAWITPRSGTYPRTFTSAAMDHQLEVTVLVQRMGDAEERQDTLDDYLDPTGSSSLLAALNATAVGAHGSSLQVKGYRDYGGYEFGEQTYLGFTLDVEVLVD